MSPEATIVVFMLGLLIGLGFVVAGTLGTISYRASRIQLELEELNRNVKGLRR